MSDFLRINPFKSVAITDIEMPDSKELFSSQTRQTRTALNLSSVSLFLFSTVGQFPEDTEYFRHLPTPFEIHQFWFGPILATAVIYFGISFFISTEYDIANNKNRNVLRNVIRAYDEYISLTHQISDDYHEHHRHFIDNMKRPKNTIESINLDKLRNPAARLNIAPEFSSFTNDTATKIEELSNYISEYETHSTKLRDELIRLYNSNATELSKRVDRIKNDSKGIHEAKDKWLDKFWPIIGASIAILSYGLRIVLDYF